ncbi:TetR/AcrR family transcriptional regulator [Rhodococcus sp. HNM0563]|uniref:TetR family transcriptional regulator n=1 Tax=unclassified Rhodococcus (in: high G+C Gram-positive bacteria) TaxID=192944 RepID=UPI00146F2224|nr:TetR/AcrR family transcriptional regulator [Rhodococcus sp. F64268]MCK0093658.1 TetR/AcrR family transcriptional regulator [Rhodococcus sp. F64268]NLU65373.1 TetR/AcrR family transcriptional regulator [Rhodococcus sp. HNM0563]
MPPPPAARAKLLDAFVTILLEQGERAATLDAVAAAAGVSKGGLLYHFPSKDALVEGLADHVEELAAGDAALMRDAPEGPAAYYIRTSVYADTPLDRAIIATTRLSQNAIPRARLALTRISQGWMDVLADTVTDPATARAVMLIGDGLYYSAAMSGETNDTPPEDVDELLEVVQRLIGRP